MSIDEAMFPQENLDTIEEDVPGPATPILHVMIGLPRSGKSTYARSLGIPMVEVDAIRKALTGQDFCPDAEMMVWSITKTMVNALFLAGHTEVVLDEAYNCMASYRELWPANGELIGYEVVYHLVPTSREVCIERAIQEGNYTLAHVINRLAREWDYPQDFEGRQDTPPSYSVGQDDDGETD